MLYDAGEPRYAHQEEPYGTPENVRTALVTVAPEGIEVRSNFTRTRASRCVVEFPQQVN